MKEFIERSIQESIFLKQKIFQSASLIDMIVQIQDVTTKLLSQGGKVLLCGNGGSASDAQHLAGEFVSRLRFDRAPLPAIAFNCNASVMTAIGNDYEFNQIFERQLRALGKKGDILWCFSSTGNSENIRRTLEAARQRDICTVGFLGGDGGVCREFCDYILLVPGNDTPRVQECHIMLGHILCDCIEQNLFSKNH